MNYKDRLHYAKSIEMDQEIVWENYLIFLFGMQSRNHKENVNTSKWYLSLCSKLTAMQAEIMPQFAELNHPATW